MQVGVDFREGGKPENPEKNPRSKGEINYVQQLYSHESQVWDSAQMVTHPATDSVRPGLTWSLVVKGLKGNTPTMYATQASLQEPSSDEF